MTTVSVLPESFIPSLRSIVGPSHVVEAGDALETLSKDFYWYSPVLKLQLDEKRAAAAVRVSTLDELRQVLSLCWRNTVPVVVRGGGTGNYGQAVPLYGGIVIDMSRFDRILEITADGVLRTEPGARMGTIEAEARKVGWELRCLPSTWVKSSLGGFFCGGSGGIGSITWGGIAAPGNVKSVTVMSCEENPRLLKLEEADCSRALHTYGTTGVMVEIEMRLAPKYAYEQLAVSSPDWDKLLDWTDSVARNPAWHTRLVTGFEWPIPSFFKPLAKYFRGQEHVSFILVDQASAEAVIASATAAGLSTVFRAELPDQPKPPFLTDYTWNHTTLWAMKSDPVFTYIQSGFGTNFREQFEALHRRFPGEILFHIEWVSNQVSPTLGPSGTHVGETVLLGGIPLIRFVSEERLNEIIAYCAEIGVGIANPHTYTLEGGGHHPDILEKSRLKTDFDPVGLLNPGKMSTHPVNPFA